jgi:catalase
MRHPNIAERQNSADIGDQVASIDHFGDLHQIQVRASAEVQKMLQFLPGRLSDGIEPSDDPLIDLRTGAYAVSFSRRNP